MNFFDKVKGCLKKRGLDIREARRMVHDRIDRVCEGEYMECCSGV